MITVPFPNLPKDYLDGELPDWLDEHMKDRYYVIYDMNNAFIGFDYKEDAVLFILRWS